MMQDFERLPQLPDVFGPARQVAYVVEDIDAAIAEWQALGVGPFLLSRDATPLSNAYYRGERSAAPAVHIAFAYIGDMQLELIQQVGNTPSMYREALSRAHSGVHHYAVCVDDFPAAYGYALDHGFDAVVDAGVDGLARMSYVENLEQGLILEVIEWNALTRPYFDELAQRVAAIDDPGTVQTLDLDELTPKLAVMGGLARFMWRRAFGRIEKTRRTPATQGAAS